MAYRFQNINSDMSQADIVAAMNRNFQALDGEAVTKLIKQAVGQPAMISGQMPDGNFGELFYGTGDNPPTMTIGQLPTGFGQVINDGTNNRILIGQAPDGHIGIWVSKTGVDVITALGG